MPFAPFRCPYFVRFSRQIAFTAFTAFVFATPDAVASPPPKDREQTASSLNPAAIARKVTPSVVTITTATRSGSGVIIDSAGLIVTSLHILRGERSASVKLNNG